MNVINLKPVAISPAILSFLENNNLIKTFSPSNKILRCKRKRGMVDTVYRSSPVFGTHKLICVKLRNSSKLRLNFHSDNEEFIIINNTNLIFKPLYLAIGLHKQDVFQKMINNKTLTNKDIMILRLKYNNPRTCIFTMLKETPHCELTEEGEGISPIFFVTEPTDLKMTKIKTCGYKFNIMFKK
jgi:hypothetical protein